MRERKSVSDGEGGGRGRETHADFMLSTGLDARLDSKTLKS